MYWHFHTLEARVEFMSQVYHLGSILTASTPKSLPMGTQPVPVRFTPTRATAHSTPTSHAGSNRCTGTRRCLATAAHTCPARTRPRTRRCCRTIPRCTGSPGTSRSGIPGCSCMCRGRKRRRTRRRSCSCRPGSTCRSSRRRRTRTSSRWRRRGRRHPRACKRPRTGRGSRRSGSVGSR